MQPLPDRIQPSFTLKQDRELIWHQGDSVRHMVVEVQAPPAPVTGREKERLPLNLAIVVDRSGSMTGPPLENAKTATCQVVDQLAEGDTLSVVAFDDEVLVVVDGGEISSTSRESIKSRIMGLESGGCTDLAAGWLQGAECVAQHIRPQSRNQVMVLSDGHANNGIIDPSILAEQASGLQNRGIITSCVGIGDAYSVDQIQALARHGGGRLHDAEHPHEIAEVMMGDLGEAMESVLDHVVFELDLPAGVRAECLSDYPSENSTFTMGSFLANAKRQAIFRLRFNAGEPGHELPVRASLSGVFADSGGSIRVSPQDVSYTHALGRDNNAQTRNDQVAEAVATVWHAQIVQRATSMNRDVDYRGASRYVKKELRYFKKYVVGLPKAEEWLDNLSRFLEVVVDHMPERMRKEIHIGASKAMYAEADYREAKRAAWSDQY